ncbi:extracellular catalytic domain type 2 short-chain-length polyhydroxyalkanoate depolymerase [Stackebrandtia nassauensis]|uniref:Poly (3-hydroxybutyrate) depolymerase n=1 Tax=Stackebrandtia nassauensis (strain DSM 44728 / CIP 108903 / NRRL B-16338 / NBRC 102104 / LLR-40K-21) TaxID=446470 RepID=D3PUT8_STANL|nr:PHB depolymerase family esterase [Stackebrandtia nassauensis]ADD44962.1 poly (3-hydroxybutyrate) depolymerase [Stackebrandtia nassauensis DSM 44728]
MIPLVLALTATLVPAATPDTDATPADVYVVGISSGGYMADQLHMAHSSTFDGLGIFSAGPYHCARGNLTTAQLACMNDLQDNDPGALQQLARDRAAEGTIDPVDNLTTNPVWIYHGRNDSTVKQSVNDDLASFYTDFGANVSYRNDSPAGHAWVSPLGPNACETTAAPYINNCGDDPQSAMLTHLLGPITAPAPQLSGDLTTFDQNPHAPGGNAATISMGPTGYRYTPSTCTNGDCRLLVALHGCKQSATTIGTTFVENAYLNEYADTNNTVVLYPQATPSTDNPNGCWNWWGYGNDPNYDTHEGQQIQAIMSMVTA